MTIIEFPKPLQEDLKQENIKRQKQYANQISYEPDSWEFEDYEIEGGRHKISSFYEKMQFKRWGFYVHKLVNIGVKKEKK